MVTHLSLYQLSVTCDVIGDNGGCTDGITARIKSVWKNFRALLPILTSNLFKAL